MDVTKHCETCGCPVKVTTGDEGTSRYEAIWPYETEQELAVEIERLIATNRGAVEALRLIGSVLDDDKADKLNRVRLVVDTSLHPHGGQ